MKKIMILLTVFASQAFAQSADSTVVKKVEPIATEAKKEVEKETPAVVETKPITKEAPIAKEVKKEVVAEPIAKEVKKEVVAEPIAKEVKKEIVAEPIAKEVKKDVVEEPIAKEVKKEAVEEPIAKEVKKDVVEETPKATERIEAKKTLGLASTSSATEDSAKTEEVKVEPKPEIKKVVVKEITPEEKKRLIEKNIKAKDIKNQVLNRRIEVITLAFKNESEEVTADLKKVIRKESQYVTDIEKIKKSTFLTQRIKDKKIAYTNNKLRKVVVDKDDLVDDIEKLAYARFTNIIEKRRSYVRSLQGTDKIIEKMNIRLELMKIGRSLLDTTKEGLAESYNIKIVDSVIDGMERNYIKKYEALISSYK